MQGFEDVTIAYKGAEYTIKSNRVLMAAADVEDAIRGTGNVSAMQVLLRPGGPSHARLSLAFGRLLHAAGAVADPQAAADDVYLSIQNDFAQGKADSAEMVQNAIFAIIQLLSPPMAQAIAGIGEGAENPGEQQAAG